jgi:heme-degrading monooxygenase HmoA
MAARIYRLSRSDMDSSTPNEEGAMIYSSGIWTVKEGLDDDFVRMWESDVMTLPADHPGLVPRLLRDVDDPRRFVSLVGPWRSREALEAVRSAPEFAAGMERAQEVLESLEVFTYELVVEVS